MHAIYTEVTAAHLIVLSGMTYQFDGSKPWKNILRLVVSDDDGYDANKVLWGFNNVNVGNVDENDGLLMPLSVL